MTGGGKQKAEFVLGEAGTGCPTWRRVPNLGLGAQVELPLVVPVQNVNAIAVQGCLAPDRGSPAKSLVPSPLRAGTSGRYQGSKAGSCGPSVRLQSFTKGIPTLLVAGAPDQTYVLQAAPTLALPPAWPSLDTNASGSDGLVEFTDSAATHFTVNVYRGIRQFSPDRGSPSLRGRSWTLSPGPQQRATR